MPRSNGAMQKLEDETKATAPGPQKTEPYIDAKVFEGKPKISRVAEIEWVWNHIDVHVTIEDAPSAGAWSMLTHARENPFQRQKFYDTFATKLIPPKNKLDQDGRHEDDGREQLKILDAVEREMLKDGEVCSACGGNGRV